MTRAGWPRVGRLSTVARTGVSRQHFIFNAERGKAGAPAPIPFGVTMVAPVIYTYGTEEQKARFLPRILNSDDWWCQGYSEPGAGSDLASLQCKASGMATNTWLTAARSGPLSPRLPTGFSAWCAPTTVAASRMASAFLLIDMTTPG